MKLLRELINEAATETYMVNLKDGSGFNVKADSTSMARSIAKDRLRPGQVIDKVVKDIQSSSNMDVKKERLNKFIDNNRKFQTNPSQARTFKRQIDRASTSAKLQEVSDAIDEFVGGTPSKKDQE